MKRSIRKGCKVFAAYVMDDKDKDNKINVKGIPRKVTIGEIYALQMKILVRKGYKVFCNLCNG